MDPKWFNIAWVIHLPTVKQTQINGVFYCNKLCMLNQDLCKGCSLHSLNDTQVGLQAALNYFIQCIGYRTPGYGSYKNGYCMASHNRFGFTRVVA